MRELVRFCREQAPGRPGVPDGSIPGTVGGALAMNAGAHGEVDPGPGGEHDYPAAAGASGPGMPGTSWTSVTAAWTLGQEEMIVAATCGLRRAMPAEIEDRIEGFLSNAAVQPAGRLSQCRFVFQKPAGRAGLAPDRRSRAAGVPDRRGASFGGPRQLPGKPGGATAAIFWNWRLLIKDKVKEHDGYRCWKKKYRIVGED